MRYIYLLLLFTLTSCRQPYWRVESYGRLDSLVHSYETLKLETHIRESFYNGFESICFYNHKDVLYTTYSKYKLYFIPNMNIYDTILLWNNNYPIDISNNKAILDYYKIFEHEFNNWEGSSLQNCSNTEIFTIIFRRDTSLIIDRSCKFNAFSYLAQLIQESSNHTTIYAITSTQADSIFYERYEQQD